MLGSTQNSKEEYMSFSSLNNKNTFNANLIHQSKFDNHAKDEKFQFYLA